MLECVVTQGSSGDMMSLQLRPLGSTASTTSWSLVSALPRLGVGVGTVYLRWLQGLLRFLVAIPVPKARDQGRQWQWPKLVVCTHSFAGVSCRCLCGGRHLLLTQTQWCGLEQAAQVGANCGHIRRCRHPGCPHVLPGLALAPSSRGQGRGVGLGACRCTAGGAIVLSAGWTAGVRLALLGGSSCVRSRRGRFAFQRGSELLRARRTDRG